MTQSNWNQFIKSTYMKGLMAAVFAVAITFLGSATTFAETNTANTLKVSPVRSDIEIKPGESKTVKVMVTNLTDASISVRPFENDFVSGDENGTPALILEEGQFAPTHSLKRFMKPLSDLTIPAKQARVVNVVISVPNDAQAGGYFGAVRFAPTNPDSGGQVNLSASVASLILLKVPGEVTEKLEITDFTIKQDGAAKTFFNGTSAMEAAVRFTSQSGVQLSPFGKVSVKKGDKVVYETDFNNGNPRDMILPGSARRWNVPLSTFADFGEYKLVATFTYGDKNQTIEVVKSFWVIPMWVIITAVVVLLVIIAVIVGIWLHRRKGSSPQFRSGKGKLRR